MILTNFFTLYNFKKVSVGQESVHSSSVDNPVFSKLPHIFKVLQVEEGREEKPSLSLGL